MPKPAPRLERTTFTMSRTLEYFTERELTQQMEAPMKKWPLALTKELIDNALDACESDESDRAPVIKVTLDGASITVEDNGPGLPEETLRRSLDYTTRTSDKAHYVSPTRGQLGNALKCLWAGPFVYSGICGNERAANIEITTPRYAYDIAVTVDQIRQMPSLDVIDRKDRPNVKIGTIIKTEWPDHRFIFSETPDSYNDDEDDESLPPMLMADVILDLLQDYATFNPHATFCFHHDGRDLDFPAIVGSDWPKWKSDYPTSSHWYTTDDLRTLIAGHIANGDENKTVRDLIKSFRGLSATAKQKQVTATASLTGKCLKDMIRAGNIDLEMVERLRQAMCAASRPVQAARLGLIGEEALAKRLIEIDGAVPDSIHYAKHLTKTGLPHVTETAFGLRAKDSGENRIRYGLNFSAALDIPRSEIPAWLSRSQQLGSTDAVCLIVHEACPRFKFLGKGKATLA